MHEPWPLAGWFLLPASDIRRFLMHPDRGRRSIDLHICVLLKLIHQLRGRGGVAGRCAARIEG